MTTYQNPILKGDFSDPDAIRVGDDFYMIASSFTYFPGLPLLHSKDLVNWNLVNYIAKELPFDAYNHTMHKKGIWAPAIRFHEGEFYVYVCTPDEGLFLYKAKDPFGDWEMHHVLRVTGWIDPCPVWDEEGNAYLVHAFAGSRAGINSIIYVHKMNKEGTKIIDNGKLVFDGGEEHHTTEGPKAYRRNGYYYIMAPAGGVVTGWQIVMRSKNIYGPYEVKVTLHQGDSIINGPHQGAYIEMEDGNDWFLHFQDRGAYGRITHLQPVYWEEDWPMMGMDTNGDGIGEPVLTYESPVELTDEMIEQCNSLYEKRGIKAVNLPEISDDFDSKTLGLQWQWQANPNERWYSLTQNPGNLRLHACKSEKSHSLFHAPWFLSHLMQEEAFQITTKITLRDVEFGDKAGLAMMGYQYSYIALEQEEGQYVVKQYSGKAKDISIYDQEVVCETCEEKHIVKKNEITMRMEVEEGGVIQYYYSVDEETFIPIGNPQVATAGGWTGARPGIFCGNFLGRISTGYADFQYYQVK
ncbi:glycoside hydrolase family 43 protein [Anaerosporobacter sp.]|uniref:glycoside hydrolase family 43 protein n=1 Tax=Anaerosporobacter sp. TaxID=1872529 RepID=UPI00286EF424|nr:glycoside hydrolase 43 family protein [Anaerosporobacter sp.]